MRRTMAGAGMLDRAGLKRVISATIEAFQLELVRNGKLPEDCLLSVQTAGMCDDESDAVLIGEAELGLDSLDRLDLVARMNRAFGLDVTGIEDYLLIRRTVGDWVNLVGVHFDKVRGDGLLGFATSGSTGEPRVVKHRLAALESEVAALIDSLGLDCSSDRRVLAMVPPHHIYGFLWTVLLPCRGNLEVVDFSKALPSALFRSARPGDIVVATPFIWERIARGESVLRVDMLGVSSGAPTTEATWAAASQLGIERFMEVYGATETGGIGIRTGKEKDFSLLPDLEVRDGGLWRLDTRLDLQDNLDWVSDRTFRVAGRKDRVIQVAGVNVNLALLRHRLLEATGADDAAVRLADDRLKAFIVVPERQEASARDAVHALLKQLPAPERPVEISFGAALPRSVTGKSVAW